jgi:hypothetical protein
VGLVTGAASPSPGAAAVAAKRWWNSSWATAAFLIAYAVWAGAGLVRGMRELRDPDMTLPAKLHLVAKRSLWVTLEGNILLFYLRRENRRCPFLGPGELRIEAEDTGPGVLRLALQCEESERDGRLAVIDGASGRSHVLDGLGAWRIDTEVPLPSMRTTLRFEPSSSSLRYRVLALSIEPGGGAPAAAPRREWHLAHEAPTHKIELGSGWWPRAKELEGQPAGPAEVLWSKRVCYLRVTALREGTSVIGIPFSPALPDGPPPLVSGEGMEFASAASVRDGMLVVQAATLVGQPIVVRCEFPGALRSPREAGRGSDLRRLAYGFKLAQSFAQVK